MYIDDDFCQGISNSLAANMELMSPPEFFDSLDFDFLSAEIFHTQEQEFDSTITDNEKLKQIDYYVEKNDEIENEDVTEKSLNGEVPICDDEKEEIEEPKV